MPPKRNPKFEWQTAFIASRLTGNTGFIGLLVSTFDNGDGKGFFISQNRISKLTGLSEKTVRDQLHRLMQAGWIVRTQKGSKAVGASTYQLVVPPTATAAAGLESELDDQFRPSRPNAPRLGQPDDPLAQPVRSPSRPVTSHAQPEDSYRPLDQDSLDLSSLDRSSVDQATEARSEGCGSAIGQNDSEASPQRPPSASEASRGLSRAQLSSRGQGGAQHASANTDTDTDTEADQTTPSPDPSAISPQPSPQPSVREAIGTTAVDVETPEELPRISHLPDYLRPGDPVSRDFWQRLDERLQADFEPTPFGDTGEMRYAPAAQRNARTYKAESLPEDRYLGVDGTPLRSGQEDVYVSRYRRRSH